MNNLEMIAVTDMISKEDFDSRFFSEKEKEAMIEAWKLANENNSIKSYNQLNPSFKHIKENFQLKLENALNAFQNSDRSIDIENNDSDYEEAVRDMYLTIRLEDSTRYSF